MKKILLAALFVISASAAFSQVGQGQWLVGGEASFSSEKHGDYKATDLTLSPDAGYFFIDQLAGGLRLNVMSSKTKYAGSEDYKSSAFSIAPFVRYYFLPNGQKTNIFADASYGFGSSKVAGESSSINGYGIKAGPAFFLTPNTALELTVGYSSFKYENVSDRDNTVSVGLGFQIHLDKAKK